MSETKLAHAIVKFLPIIITFYLSAIGSDGCRHPILFWPMLKDLDSNDEKYKWLPKWLELCVRFSNLKMQPLAQNFYFQPIF